MVLIHVPTFYGNLTNGKKNYSPSTFSLTPRSVTDIKLPCSKILWHNVIISQTRVMPIYCIDAHGWAGLQQKHSFFS